MPKTKKVYIEITTINELVSDERLYDILKKNIDKSYIRIYSVNKVTRSDIK